MPYKFNPFTNRLDYYESSGGGTVTSVSGTANRITVTNPTTTPVIDIAATYIGQTSITTLGTIVTGVWNGTAIGPTFGGTGQTTYTTGDILYASAANTLSKLPIGTAGKVLTVTAGIPAWQTAGGGGFTAISRQVFSANGTYTPTPGMVYADVEVVGGGAGGGGCDNSIPNFPNAGGGGGGGGYAREILTAATIGVSQAVTIGAGGAGGVAGPNNGSPGGSSSFGALLASTGGGGGSLSGGGSAGDGGPGGTGSGGDYNVTGTPGTPGTTFATGGGGQWGNGGPGGSSFFGGGAQGAVPNNNGNNATSFGGGGSGGVILGSTGAVAGGNGFDGAIIVTEYIL